MDGAIVCTMYNKKEGGVKKLGALFMDGPLVFVKYVNQQLCQCEND